MGLLPTGERGALRAGPARAVVAVVLFGGPCGLVLAGLVANIQEIGAAAMPAIAAGAGWALVGAICWTLLARRTVEGPRFFFLRRIIFMIVAISCGLVPAAMAYPNWPRNHFAPVTAREVAAKTALAAVLAMLALARPLALALARLRRSPSWAWPVMRLIQRRAPSQPKPHDH